MRFNPLRKSYQDRIGGIEPANLIGYWPLGEDVGNAARNLSQYSGLNGAHTATTVGVGLEDARGQGKCSVYDGTNSFTNIYSAKLAGPAELITNGGFETAGGGGADIWAGWIESAGDGALADETVLVHSGGHAAKLTSGASVNTTVGQDITVVPGTTYQISLWTRSDGTHSGTVMLYDNVNAATLYFEVTGIVGTTYEQVSIPLTAPAGCTSLLVRFISPWPGGIAYFDDVSVQVTDSRKFNGAEGTLLIWAKVANVGVWTDGTVRTIACMKVDANNLVSIGRVAANGTITFDYKAGGTAETQATGSLSSIGWDCYAMTWSVVADTVTYYINGAISGTADTVLGTWTGAPAATTTILGASATTPGDVWSGSLAHCALWSRALTPGQIAFLSSL